MKGICTPASVEMETAPTFYAAVAPCQADQMLSFAANISVLFTEFDFLGGFAQASKAGFVAVEFNFRTNTRRRAR